MDQRHARPPLGAGLWLFVVTRIVGLVLNVGFVILFVVWVLPVVSFDEGGGSASDLFGEVLLPVPEIVATLIGVALVFRRAPSVRRYWLVCLSLFCLVQLWQVFTGPEPAGATFFLVAGLGWLAYWVWAPRARQLPLEGFWTHPEDAGE